MSDHLCPECGADLVGAAGEGDVGICIQCEWSGDLEDAAVDTSSPFDVRGTQPMFDGDRGEVVICLSKTKTVRLSPQKAENFAEALQHAARDARGHREPEDDHLSGGEP